MTETRHIEILPGLAIPEDELTFTASRSSGPGGQHVNKVSTRITLLFDVAHSPSLSDVQRGRIMEKLRTRINREGVLRVVCQKHRSQLINRNEAAERFVNLLQRALEESPLRKKIPVPVAVKQHRLEQKKRQSLAKKERSKKIDWDED